MKIVKLCLLLLVLVVNLKAQDILQEVVTWQVPEGSIFRLRQLNNGGSDLNNDGYDDFIHWLPEEIFKFQFYLGSSSPNSTFDFEIEVPFGSANISWGGDLNGNGYKDIVYTNSTYYNDPGRVHICFGKEIGEIDLIPDMTLYGQDYVSNPTALNYQGFNGGYDFNGDGYDDLLIIADGPSYFWNGLVQIFFGGEEMSNVPDFHIQGNTNQWLGSFATVADFNGDGYDDLIISRSVGEDVYYVQLELYLGGETMSTTPHYVSEIYGIYGGFFTPAKGDINGDGYDDIIVPDVGIFLGNEDGVLHLDYPDFWGRFININNDGYTDIIKGSPEHKEIYLGSENIDLTNPDIVINHERASASGNIGDFLGNGSDELLMSFAGNTNSATLYTFDTSHTDETVISVEHHLINFPNPFNPATTIQFSGEPFEPNELLTLQIYNLKGQKIRQFDIQNAKFNMNEVVWDGTDEFGNSVSSGVYLYRIKNNTGIYGTKKMILLK